MQACTRNGTRNDQSIKGHIDNEKSNTILAATDDEQIKTSEIFNENTNPFIANAYKWVLK